MGPPAYHLAVLDLLVELLIHNISQGSISLVLILGGGGWGRLLLLVVVVVAAVEVV